MPSGLSVYGRSTYQYKTTVTKWCYHRIGKQKGERWYKRRTHKTVTRTYRKRERRFTFYGSTPDINKAYTKMKIDKWIPKKQYQDRVNAQDFLLNPSKYAKHGIWKKLRKRVTPDGQHPDEREAPLTVAERIRQRQLT